MANRPCLLTRTKLLSDGDKWGREMGNRIMVPLPPAAIAENICVPVGGVCFEERGMPATR